MSDLRLIQEWLEFGTQGILAIASILIKLLRLESILGRVIGAILLLLMGGEKDQQQKEIDKAKQYWEDHRSSKKKKMRGKK